MNNFDMAKKVFGETEGKRVIKLLKGLPEIQAEDENKFLIKLSYKLEKLLKGLEEYDEDCYEFWKKRRFQLKVNRKNKEYILFIVKVLSELNQKLLVKKSFSEIDLLNAFLSEDEKVASEAKKRMSDSFMTENEEGNMYLSVCKVFQKYRYSSENDDSEYLKYLEKKEVQGFLDELGEKNLTGKGGEQ